MPDYPYVLIGASDTNGNPVTVKLQVSAESPVTSEAEIVDLVRDFVTGLPGVTVNGVMRYAVTETPA